MDNAQEIRAYKNLLLEGYLEEVAAYEGSPLYNILVTDEAFIQNREIKAPNRVLVFFTLKKNNS